MPLTRAFTQVALTRATANDTVFERSREVSPDTTDYEVITSRAGARDQLRTRRAMPSNTSSVTAAKKGGAKLTREFTYTNENGIKTVLPRVLELNYSIPIVATDAQIDEIIVDLRSLVNEPDFLESMFKVQAI